MKPVEKQITHDDRQHQLTNSHVWTADGRWIVYDLRPTETIFTGTTIERVDVYTKKQEVIYRATDGAYVGVATVSPDMPARYICIHSPELPDRDWHYAPHHRRGVIIQDHSVHTMDACIITPPFAPGALRGGSHVHVFSGEGSRISFTYNDHVMHENCPAKDLRNVGIALPFQPVYPPIRHPREHYGSHFCVLVSKTTHEPRPGTDDINRAYEEGWIGTEGYRKQQGQQQRWAIAFIGDTLSADGRTIPEVFIVDLPSDMNDYRVAGELPIEGSENELPSPPFGVNQRRLTFTHQRPYPGVVTVPRHWLRTPRDGEAIGFLMKDNDGCVQFWTVSPHGGEPRQITKTSLGIQSSFSWHPGGRHVAFACNNEIVLCEVVTGKLSQLTQNGTSPISPQAVVFSPDGQYITYLRTVKGFQQIFVVTVPPSLL